MLDILTDITQGKGKPTDIELLIELSNTIKIGSLCGLGQTAPNPVLTTLQYFMAEYETHINEKQCPALVCKELIEYTIYAEKCAGCHMCYNNCPVSAISGEPGKIHTINSNECIKCGICLEVCPQRFSAIEKKPRTWVQNVSQEAP
jgi:NADH-quinone oxidoreductase subunit F